MPARAKSAKPASGAGSFGTPSSGAVSGKAALWALVALRLFVGAKLLVAGLLKWDWIGTTKLSLQLSVWIRQIPFDFYAGFLSRTVMPQNTLFTYLLVAGEIGVGLMLLLGLFTRLNALAALLLNANYLLATWHLGPAWQGINQAFLTIELALLIAGGGRTFGLDARLARKYPGGFLW